MLFEKLVHLYLEWNKKTYLVYKYKFQELQRALYHFSAEKLLKVLRQAHAKQSELSDAKCLENIFTKCHTFQRFGPKPSWFSFPKVGRFSCWEQLSKELIFVN